MTVHHLTQLSCENDRAHVYPDPPAEDTTVAEVRQRAEAAGWEVGRSGGNGRELCPDCRIAEIKQAMDGGTDGVTGHPRPARAPRKRAVPVPVPEPESDAAAAG